MLALTEVLKVRSAPSVKRFDMGVRDLTAKETWPSSVFTRRCWPRKPVSIGGADWVLSQWESAKRSDGLCADPGEGLRVAARPAWCPEEERARV